MSRNSLGIKTEVFASGSAANRVPLPTFVAKGYGSEYVSDVFPDRRHMNDVLARVTATCADVNKFGGALPWDDGITYETGAFVFVGGVPYVSILGTNNLDKNPVTEALYWKSLHNFLGINQLKTDTEYIPITGTTGTTPITQNSNNTYTYAIATLVGSGLVHAEIRELHISCYLQSNYDTSGNTSGLSATYPYDTVPRIVYKAAQAHLDDSNRYDQSIVKIPINKGQENIKLKLDFSNAGNFTIIGATQRCL